MDEAGVRPNLMTRFRGEYYAKHPEWFSKKAKAKEASPNAVQEERDRVRHEYFRKSPKGRYKVPKAAERLI